MSAAAAPRSPMPDMRALFGSASAPVATLAPPPLDGPADALRLRLAVRGWVVPLGLVDPDAGPAQAKAIIESLSREVETAVETRPGQWFLSVAARKREFARRSRAELRVAAARLDGDGRDDPVQGALLIALRDPPTAMTASDLAALSTPVLGALATAFGWFPPGWPLPVEARDVADALALRTLDADLARMTQLPLVGAVHKQTLVDLRDFCTRTTTGSLAACYIHGGGGGGKTTLLAFLQRDLRLAARPVAVARIDFDEPAIDPARMVTLNLAVFEQLARTSPAIGAQVSGMLPVLRQTALVQRKSSTPRPDMRRAQKRNPSLLAEETVVSQSASDEGSILYGLLGRETGAGPVVIILDTAELVLAHSDRIASSIVVWLDFLRQEAGAGTADLRLVIAGRDPPPAQDDPDAFAVHNLLSRLQQSGTAVSPVIALPELEPAESAELLRNCGLDDDAVIASAAAAVPGNPLLLSITADALKSGDDAGLAESVRAAHLASQIDADSARNYLMRRIVAHVSDPQARPYVLPALYSPLLTRDLLEEAIIPAVDRMAGTRAVPGATDDPAARRAARRMADRVFVSLGATNWLTRPSRDTRVVAFNRDIRAFALKLLAATPESTAIERDLRQAAQIVHLKRRSLTDKALAVYQAAMLGDRYTLPRDPIPFGLILRGLEDELPPRLRNWLAPVDPVRIPAPQKSPAASGAEPDAPQSSAQPAVSDATWRLYLEGDGSREGEGWQMVRDDRAREALDLYRSRPTRVAGQPPTFVIRALADLGEWHGPDVDVQAIIDVERREWFADKQPSQDALARIYWLTRLALFRAIRLSPPHLDILETAAATATGPGFALLPGVIAIAAVASGELSIPDRLRTGTRGSIDEPRLYLADTDDGGGKARLHLGQIAVVQQNWQQRLARHREMIDASRLTQVQARINALDDRPLAEVNQLVDGLRETIDIHLSARSLDAEILILRGQTSEFLRPLREAMLLCGDGEVGPRVRSVIDPVLARMTIRPAEMKPSIFYARLGSNPRAWYTALVGYADRCRLLPELCRAILEHEPPEQPASIIAASFLAWDKALCRGTSSNWIIDA